MHARRRDIDLARDTSCISHKERIAGRGRVIHDLSAVVGPGDFCDAMKKVAQLTPRDRGRHQLDIFGVRSIGAARPYGDERAVGREAECADQGLTSSMSFATGQIAVAPAADLGQPHIHVSIVIGEKGYPSAVP